MAGGDIGTEHYIAYREIRYETKKHVLTLGPITWISDEIWYGVNMIHRYLNQW